jgi:hypothetical protein
MEASDREDEHELRNQRGAEREEYLAKGKAVAERFDDVQAVADAAIVAAGFHKHKGQWQRKRRSTVLQRTASGPLC